MLKSLQSGAIDGTALTPPASFFAEDLGFYPLFSFINEVGALQGGVATNSTFLNGRKEIAQRFIRATVKGLRHFKSDRSGTVKIMTKYMNLKTDTAVRVYDESVPSFVSDGTISEDFQDRVLDFELKTIGTDKKISRDKVFDFSLTKKATNK